MSVTPTQEPQFEGQTKTKLGNSEVMGAVDQAVSEMLENYLEEHPKDARQIVDKVILAATARHAARKARELVQRKGAMSGMGFLAWLDANGCGISAAWPDCCPGNSLR